MLFTFFSFNRVERICDDELREKSVLDLNADYKMLQNYFQPPFLLVESVRKKIHALMQMKMSVMLHCEHLRNAKMKKRRKNVEHTHLFPYSQLMLDLKCNVKDSLCEKVQSQKLHTYRKKLHLKIIFVRE